MTPQLRFSEFTDEWRVRKFSEIADGKLSNGVFNDPSKVGSGYKLINVKDMYVDGFIDESSLTKVNINAREFSKNKVKNGDLFFTRSSLVKEGIAYTNIYLSNSEDITFDGHLIKLSPDKAQTSPEFLYYISKSNASRRQLVTFGTTTTMTTIGQREVANVILYFPSKPEQEKIADFLTAVDERIAVGEKKLELLETYKRGVMQKIFSQQIRFKDENGEDYPEWEEKKLGDLIEKNKKRNKNIAVNYVQSVSNKHGFVSQDEYFDGANIASKNTSNYFVIEKGTFAYNPSRINVGSLAYKTDTETSIVSPLYVSFKTKKDLKNEFLLSWFSTQTFVKQMHRAFEGSVRDTLSYEALSSMKMIVPHKNEQQKIATFLTALDDKITAEKSKLTAAKKFKKALLQRMFV